MDGIIIEPVLTEKSNILRERNKYVFRVDARANKLEVMEAIKSLFDVHPVACNIMKQVKVLFDLVPALATRVQQPHGLDLELPAILTSSLSHRSLIQHGA